MIDVNSNNGNGSMKAHYNYNDFLKGCRKKQAKVTHKAQTTARRDFNLATEKEVLGFIGNGGLENPKFINSKKWEKNPDPKSLIMIDAYEFYSGFTFGYVAFYYQLKTNYWLIKSFKKNINSDPRNLVFEGLSKLLH